MLVDCAFRRSEASRQDSPRPFLQTTTGSDTLNPDRAAFEKKARIVIRSPAPLASRSCQRLNFFRGGRCRGIQLWLNVVLDPSRIPPLFRQYRYCLKSGGMRDGSRTTLSQSWIPRQRPPRKKLSRWQDLLASGAGDLITIRAFFSKAARSGFSVSEPVVVCRNGRGESCLLASERRNAQSTST